MCNFVLYGIFIISISGEVYHKRLLWLNKTAHNFKFGGKLKRNKNANLPYKLKIKVVTVDLEMRPYTFDP